MTLVLVWASMVPVGASIPHHHLTHLVTFGLFAMAWSFALPRVPAVLIAVTILAFGFAQEALEIVGHAHGFELSDAIVDGVGAVAGVAFSRLLKDALRSG